MPHSEGFWRGEAAVADLQMGYEWTAVESGPTRNPSLSAFSGNRVLPLGGRRTGCEWRGADLYYTYVPKGYYQGSH